MTDYILGYKLLFDLDWKGGPNWYGSHCFSGRPLKRNIIIY